MHDVFAVIIVVTVVNRMDSSLSFMELYGW